jgi:hypothetical protein
MHKFALTMAVSLSAFAFVAPASAGLPHPPAGTPARGFATEDSGCLGGLRSAIARGELGGITLNGFTIPAGFSGAFNPGDHFGTVAEAAFLEQVLGISPADLGAFCARFG